MLAMVQRIQTYHYDTAQIGQHRGNNRISTRIRLPNKQTRVSLLFAQAVASPSLPCRSCASIQPASLLRRLRHIPGRMLQEPAGVPSKESGRYLFLAV